MAGWAEKLIFSGAALDSDSRSNAEAMQEQAIKAGVPSSAIAIDELAQNTQENATNISALTAKDNHQRLIVVTSNYHQRRAYIEFSEAFPNAEIISHPVKSDNQWDSAWWLTPQGWWLAIGELTKILFTAIRG